MATNVENLTSSIASVDAQLASLTADPKPTYSLDGKSVSWGEHFRNLTQLRKDLIEALIQAEGPREAHIIGTSG